MVKKKKFDWKKYWKSKNLFSWIFLIIVLSYFPTFLKSWIFAMSNAFNGEIIKQYTLNMFAYVGGCYVFLKSGGWI